MASELQEIQELLKTLRVQQSQIPLESQYKGQRDQVQELINAFETFLSMADKDGNFKKTYPKRKSEYPPSIYRDSAITKLFEGRDVTVDDFKYPKKPKSTPVDSPFRDTMQSLYQDNPVYRGLVNTASGIPRLINPYTHIKGASDAVTANDANILERLGIYMNALAGGDPSIPLSPGAGTGGQSTQAANKPSTPTIPPMPTPAPSNQPTAPTGVAGGAAGGAGTPGGGGYLDAIRKLAARQDAQAAAELKGLQGLPVPDAPNLQQSYRSMMLPLLSNMPERDWREEGDLASAYGVAQYAKPQGASLAPEAMVKANKDLLDTRFGDAWDRFKEVTSFAGKDTDYAGTDFTNANAAYNNKRTRIEDIAKLSNPTAGLDTLTTGAKAIMDDATKRYGYDKTLEAAALRSTKNTNVVKDVIARMEFYAKTLKTALDEQKLTPEEATKKQQELNQVNQQLNDLRMLTTQQDPMAQLFMGVQ